MLYLVLSSQYTVSVQALFSSLHIPPFAMPSITELLRSGSDFDLCCAVVKQIVKVHGDDLDASVIPVEHRTVLLVWNATGIIGNGGFNYLFERSFGGDPFFALTKEAFDTIGCAPAATAFRKALEMFPGGRPPTDIGRRLTIYRQGGAARRGHIDNMIWDASDQITECVANYIRAHRAQFEALASAPAKPRIFVKPPAPRQPADWEFDVMRLPHWARVAYAARCARQLIGIFDANWPGAPQDRRAAILAAIDAAEKSAANAQPVPNLEKLVTEATITAGAALRGIYGMPGFDQNVPPDGNMASRASSIAKSAEKAAEAARAIPDQSHLAAIESLHYTFRSAVDSATLDEQMQRELARLTSLAARAKWTDTTRVPPDVFDR
jgi:hypothetical protein